MPVGNVSNALHESNLTLLQNTPPKYSWCCNIPIKTCMKVLHLMPLIEAGTCTRVCQRRKMERRELRKDDLWKIDSVEYPSELHFVSQSTNEIDWKGQMKLINTIQTMLHNTRNRIGDTLRKYAPVLSPKFARQNSQVAQIAIRLATRYFDTPSTYTILSDAKTETGQDHTFTWVGPRQIEMTRSNSMNRLGLVISSYVLATPKTVGKGEKIYTIVDGQATACFKESSWYHITRSYDFNLTNNTVKELADIVHKQGVVTSQEGVRQAQWLQIPTY